jgi:hypothetical protein
LVLKLITASFIIVLLGFFLSYFFGYIEFAVMLFISLLPINILYGSEAFGEFQRDPIKYQGVRILGYPPLILSMLVLIYYLWI